MEEPQRKSALDFVRELKKLNLCRLIFCIKFTSNCEDIVQSFQRVIREKCSQDVTGLLLVHPNFMIHLLESSEDEIFKLCNEVFINHSESIANIKCLYIQNGVSKQYFKKWYIKKIKDNEPGKANEVQLNDDSFETVSALYKEMIVSLHKLYNELWYICLSESYENFIKRLDLISTTGHSSVPRKEVMDFILKSRWGYNLIDLVKDYRYLKYPSDFDDSSAVWEIVGGNHFDATEHM